MINIYDSFLPVDQWKNIMMQTLETGVFQWKYNKAKVRLENDSSLGNYQFTHLLYSFHGMRDGASHVVSPQIDIVKPILDKIKFLAIHKIKVNLEPIKKERHYSTWHTDVIGDGNKPCNTMTTAIYYVNTCDGYTEFEDGTKVNCVANRLAVFPANIKHRGVSQQDNKVKCVINFNYFEFK
tara:strand:- start:82 stop:624 length:543 start_codon:yes stop_codon:yes gene_type:complete